MIPKVIYVTTVPQTLGFFWGQIQYLLSRRFSVETISSPSASIARSNLGDAVLVHEIPMSRSMTPVADLVALWRLYRSLKELRPQIVHSHTPKAGLLGTLAARVARVPIVFLSIHGLVQINDIGLRRYLLDFCTWLSCKLAHRVCFVSHSMCNYATAKGLCSRAKSVVFVNGSVAGVDAERKFNPAITGPHDRSEIRHALQISDDALVIGFVGRIVGDKGIHELARAWHALSLSRPNLHLLLVGTFEDKDPIRADTLRLLQTDSRVHVVGYQTDVARYLSAMDIFVMPSYREGFGVANIEAAAMELPVVSTCIPGCVDSVQDGVTGTLVPSHDAEALAEALRRYLDDPELRRRHGQAGRERVLRDFRPEDIWEACYQEYTRLLRLKGLPMPQSQPVSDDN